MEFSILILILIVALLLIIISFAEKSIVFGTVGGILLAIASFIIILNGIDVPTGVSTIQTFNNISISNSLNGTVTTTNTIQVTNVKDNYTFYASFALLILSLFIMFFIYEDYKHRGR